MGLSGKPKPQNPVPTRPDGILFILETLKDKAVKGLTWSFVDNAAGQGLTFLIGIILARLLSPREFGLIGMIMVLVAISESFINSGFSSALIRKKDCTEKDYSTVFFFNLAAGILLFAILFVSAPAISRFFREPQLTLLIQVLGVVLIIDSLTLIQKAILVKRIDFKLQTKISILSSLISGAVGIGLALKGFGVWSLVAKTLFQRGATSLLLWIWNRWRPILIFSKESFQELFSFGSKLLVSGLIDTAYKNVYFLIIGKFFSAQELGFYTKADQFKKLPSQNLNNVISRVSFPVLAQLQDEPEKLKAGYQKIIRNTMLITFVLMMGLAAVAEPLVLTLIGERWRTSAGYLQLLCFVGMMYPLHALNLNMLMVQGRSDLFLKLEILKKLLAVPTIVIGIIFGIKIMILGMIVNSILAYFLNSYWSGKLIGYPVSEQLRDIAPGFFVALGSAVVVYGIGILLPFQDGAKLVIQIVLGGLLVFTICEFSRLMPYRSIKSIFVSRLKAGFHD
jgi:teichuronic acid exporter